MRGPQRHGEADYVGADHLLTPVSFFFFLCLFCPPSPDSHTSP